MASKPLHRFALATAGVTFLLLCAGAMVTSTGSGLAVPDWPLSFGKWMPTMKGGVLYEHGHRIIATTVGALTLILALWMIFREPRAWVRRLAIVALAAVVVQGVLGGLTVKYKLPAEVSIGHACLAEAFFALMVALTLFTSAGWAKAPETAASAMTRRMALLALGATYVQIGLGAVVRHTGGGTLYHIVGAVIALGCIMGAASHAMTESPAVRRPAIAAMALSMVQIALGFAALTLRVDKETPLGQRSDPQIFLASIHLAVGALIFASLVVLTLRAFQPPVPAPAPAPQPEGVLV